MKKLFLAIAIFAINVACFAQTNDSSTENQYVLSYIKRAMRFAQYYPQEKVYLHLDNNGYFKGETIWFKAYVTRCDIANRTDLSHVLYVELLNPSGDVVEKRKLAITNGEANGDIKIDSIMTTGFYEIRAYTRYMTNWGTNACFSRVIPIFNAPKHEGDYNNPTLDKFSYRHRLNNERLSSSDNDNGSAVDLNANAKEKENEHTSSVKVHFYPEGGNCIQGLPSRVAFTVADNDGNPLFTECKVTTTEGKVVQSTTTDKQGRGTFNFSSDDDAKNFVVKTNNGKEKTLQLPEQKQSGCTMTLDLLDDDSLKADLYSSADIIGHKLGYVVIHNGSIIRCDTLTSEDHKSFSFNRHILPEGVSQLTVFDSKGAIMAERLFFILGEQKTAPNINVTTNTENLKPCGKVTINLQSRPNSDISFSAMDSHSMLNGNIGNINTWMLLGSELRGYISNPEYYFESDDTEHRKAADLLMMIQGWRRYDWNIYAGSSLFTDIQPIEDKLRIYGKVKGKTKRTPIKNVNLKALVFKKGEGLLDGEFNTDSIGRYMFELPDINDEWNLQIASKYKEKAANYKICIDRNFTPKSRFIYPEETAMIPIDNKKIFKWNAFKDEDDKYISMTKKDHVLKNVTVKAKGRVWDRTGWGDEASAKKFSMIYYNCDADLEKIEDAGEYPPSVVEWLESKNGFFAGEASPTDVLIYMFDREAHVDTTKAIYDWFEPSDYHYDEYETMPPAPNRKFYRDGLSYKNRPIVWIIDNMFVTITNYQLRGKEMPMKIQSCDNAANTMDLPVSLDELKCVYVSEDSRAMLPHIRCLEIEQMNPVVLYCYSHRKSAFLQKGTRYTHFEGFNTPSVFQMEDYSVVPPMEDFRRTLYWAPSVRTDANGKATVEFYNNSSCTDMFISAEGMDSDGQFLYY